MCGRWEGALAPPSYPRYWHPFTSKSRLAFMTTIDHRGRDLAIIPDDTLLGLTTPELLSALFGSHLPSDVRATIGRDKRHAFLRTLPIHFQAIKQALRARGTPFDVAFD